MSIFNKRKRHLHLTVVGFLLLTCFSLAQDDDSTGPNPYTPEMDNIVQAWFKETNAKLLPKAYGDIPARLEKLSMDQEHFYIPWEGNVGLDQAGKLGVPLEKDISKLEGTQKSYIVHLKSLKVGTLDGWKLTLAEYKDDILEDQLLFLKPPSGPATFLYGGGGCNEFHMFKAGSRGPLFLHLRSSGCGSGFGEYLYHLLPDGRIEEVAKLGGWHAGIAYVDLDGDGVFEIVDSSDELSTPEDLVKRLEKVKGYDRHRGWVRVNHARILKWDGKAYQVVGEFYSPSDF